MLPRRLGQVLRTARHIRRPQLVAWAMFAVRGSGSPVTLPGPAPDLAVAAPVAPFLTAPPHARYQVEPAPFEGSDPDPDTETRHTIELVNQRVVFPDRVDWNHTAAGPLWAYQLHQFDYLREPAVSAVARAALIEDWIARHASGVGWDPHPISLRILSWAKLLLSEGALQVDAAAHDRIRLSLASQIETLSRNLEIRLQANHLLSNLIGVVFGGLLFQGARADGWLGFQPMLRRQLEEQVGPDGAHIERSPMYHALLLENVLDLLNLARAAGGRVDADFVALLQDKASRMLGAQRVWQHPDGDIALFSDSAFRVAHSPARLEDYAAGLGVAPVTPLRTGMLDHAGFGRLEVGPFVLIASLAGPMPSYQPGHAHCDALSFELSCGDERVVCDTGVFEYVSGDRRRIARATASHATLEVAGGEQAEIWAPHRIGGRPTVRIEEATPGERFVARCASWSTPDTTHRRTFRRQGRTIEISDEILGMPRPVRLMLPLAPGLEPRLAHDQDGGAEAHIRLASGARLRLALPIDAEWHISRTAYYPEFGREEPRACLVGEASVFESGTWRFELLE